MTKKEKTYRIMFDLLGQAAREGNRYLAGEALDIATRWNVNHPDDEIYASWTNNTHVMVEDDVWRILDETAMTEREKTYYRITDLFEKAINEKNGKKYFEEAMDLSATWNASHDSEEEIEINFIDDRFVEIDSETFYVPENVRGKYITAGEKEQKTMRTKEINMTLDLRGDLQNAVANWQNTPHASTADLYNKVWQICRQYGRAGLPEEQIRFVVYWVTGWRDLWDLNL